LARIDEEEGIERNHSKGEKGITRRIERTGILLGVENGGVS